MNEENVESLLAYCSENERVCPQPYLWNQLWELLISNCKLDADQEPSPPLILGAWHHTSDLEKKMRLTEYIHWADKHGRLGTIGAFLHHLEEKDWHHFGE